MFIDDIKKHTLTQIDNESLGISEYQIDRLTQNVLQETDLSYKAAVQQSNLQSLAEFIEKGNFSDADEFSKIARENGIELLPNDIKSFSKLNSRIIDLKKQLNTKGLPFASQQVLINDIKLS